MDKKKQLEVSINKVHEVDQENLKKTKTEVRKKKVAKQLEEDGRRENKIYELPGQSRDPPDKRDPLRIFYETLYHQVPTSELAEVWMMESGLLSEEEAKKILQKKQKTNQLQDLVSSTEAILAAKQSTKSIQSNTKNVSSDTLKKTAKKKTISSSQTDKGKKRKRDTVLVDGSSSR